LRRERCATNIEYGNFISVIMLKADETSGNVLFEEVQKFPRWVGWMVRLGMGITVLGLLVGLITEKEKMAMVIALAVVIPIAVFAVYLNSNTQLEKIVTSNGLYYRWKPWQRKYRVIEKESIKSFEVRNSLPLHYGIGWFPGYGKIHNASTGEGMQLYLLNGRKIFFSTLDTSFFKKSLDTITSSNLKPRMSEF
jgi:hypothetical protein